jgi:hypothetical protein
MAVTREQVAKLYVATFNRAPDADGLDYWVNDSGLTLEGIAQSFFDQAETQTKYPAGTSSSAFVTAIYANLFNRAPDADGLAYWVKDLDEGKVTQDKMILAVVNGALGNDARTLANKAAVGLYFADAGLENADFSLAAVTYENESMVLPMNQVDVLAAELDFSQSHVTINGTAIVEAGAVVAPTLAATGVAKLTGNKDVRIDLTNPTDQLQGIDLDSDGTIEANGVENNSPVKLSGVTVVDAYARNPLDQDDKTQNFLGDIYFDGTGFEGDGVSTDGNVFLGGLGSDTAFGGIGNDFMTAGQSGNDTLKGGRNADFFFVEVSNLDTVNGDSLDIDGGNTFDNSAAQDSDWLLLEASDDDEPVTITLNDNTDTTNTAQTTRSGISFSADDIENINASGNLYGFLNAYDVMVGDAALDARVTDHVVGTENFSIGTTAQMIIAGSASNNIIIAGYDNDTVTGGAGNDLLFGGDMQYLDTYDNNPNILAITNDGRDSLSGDAGDDNIHFEMDGGTIDGGANVDTLWLTDFTGGRKDNADDKASDGVVRIDLAAQAGTAASAGYGGADAGATADQTNYGATGSRVTITNMENVVATGLGAIDYDVDGANTSEVSFNKQANYRAINADLDLRGNTATNTLYAAAGDDVLEGRTGNDLLSGGEGNDDFLFDLQNGDDLDTIHRQTDIGNNITDGTFGQDFGVNSTSAFGPSSLSVDFTAANLADANVFMDSFSVQIGGVTFAVTDAAALAGVTTVAGLATLADAAFKAIDANVSVTASGNILTIKDTTPAGGRDISDTQAEGYAVSISVTAPGTGALGLPAYVAAGESVSQDRLIFVAYEDRLDAERVDDDAMFGGDTLGANAYAQDMVVGFDVDGNTVLAENQSFDITLTNLKTEDIVTISVNGVQYTLQVGKELDGTEIAGENETVLDPSAVFAARMAAYITDFLDDDTAAGQVVATEAAGVITLTQANYNGEETVFMKVAVDVDDNSSNGEKASYTIVNNSATEVTLVDFDGKDGNLNAANVLFVGDTNTSRAVLATAAAAGGALNGSDAIVVNVTADTNITSSALESITGEAIVFNATENPTTGEVLNYSIHGDDQLIGGNGNDTVKAGTGDDRVYGSKGTDTIDGGKDLYVVDGVIRVLNDREAVVVDALPATISIDQLGTEAVADYKFDDTLIYQQSDFGVVGAGGSKFEITLDLTANQANGGAGKVVVDGSAANTTLFTNMENIRTVSGNGTLAGQGDDTLDLSVSVNPLTGVETANTFNMQYDLTSNGTAGNVDLDANASGTWVAETISKVDGVENVLFGSGNDSLLIDETEAGKNNSINGGTGTDTVTYSFDIGGNNALNPAVTLTVNGGGAGVDYVDMTGASVGTDMPRDTLTNVEIVNFTDTLHNPTLKDTLDVTNVVDAVVDFVNGEVRASGDLVNNVGDETIIIGNMVDFEVVNADYADTIIVANAMANSNTSATDQDLQIDSFLNFDTVDVDNDRMTIADIRAVNGAQPQVENYGLYTFNMGPDSDTVDYSAETGLIAAVVNFDSATSITVSQVMVSDDNDVDFADGSNRVDVLTGTENLVASAGSSVIDLTQSTTGLKIRFNADDGATSTVAALDRDVYRLQLSELGTLTPVQGANFLSYYDAGTSATVAQTLAEWTQIEGSDNAEMVEMTDHETTATQVFNLRGGTNEMNYNELTRSISTVIALNTTTDVITATTSFTDGNAGVFIGGTDTTTSYSAQNAVATGSLRIEASQDKEDTFGFAASSDEKAYILGEVVAGSDQITVSFGDAANANSMVLTGYEFLLDASSNDVYTMTDMDRVYNQLSFTDNAADNDTIVVDNDAVSFGAAGAGSGAPNTIDLSLINAAYAMDFDVIDITATTSTGLTVIGAGDTTDELYVDNLAALTAINDFDGIVLNNAAVAAGSTFILDLDANTLKQGATTVALGATVATTISFNGAVLESNQFAGVTTSFDIGAGYGDIVTAGVNVTVVDTAVPADVKIVGGSGNDTITTAGGNDTIVGGLGADTLDGGVIPEVQEVQTIVITGGFGVDGSNDGAINIGGITLTEAAAAVAGVSVVDGSDADTIGAAFDAISEATWSGALGVAVDDVSYDAISNTLSVTYGTGVNPAAGALLVASGGYTPATDGGAINIGSGTDVNQVAQVDSADKFIYMSAADSTAAAMDTITNYNFSAALYAAGQADLLDISALELSMPTFSKAAAAAALADQAAMATKIVVNTVGTDSIVYIDVDGDAKYDLASDMKITLDSYAGAVGLQISAAGGLLLNGTVGADVITGTANADVIIGSGGGDTINGGDGNDTITVLGDAANAITGASGNDTINLGVAGFVDTLVYTSGLHGVDTITGFVTGEDVYNTSFVTTAGNYTFTSAAVNTGALLALAATGVTEVTGVTAAADMSVIADVMAAISNGVINAQADGADSLLAVVTTDGNTYLYEINEGADAGVVVSAADITYVGVFTAANLASADIA